MSRVRISGLCVLSGHRRNRTGNGKRRSKGAARAAPGPGTGLITVSNELEAK